MANAGSLPLHASIDASQSSPPDLETIALTPLEIEKRATLSTREAAAHLGRAPQTLRAWACFEAGPLRPVRIHGRLAWRTRDLRRLVGLQYDNEGRFNE